jgi:uroporphyrinogen-III synthase
MASSAKPLSGKRIVVTRTRDQASELTASLRALEAEVIEIPVIRISREVAKQDLADVLLELGGYDWLVFTSANGVHHFFGEFFALFDDIRTLGLVRIACIGDSTAKAIADLHLKVEYRPAKATAEALAAGIIATGSIDNARVLVVTGNLNRDVLVKKLEEARAMVDCLQVYKTEAVDLASSPAAADFRSRGADAVLFASSSSARSFVAQGAALALSRDAKRPRMGSIGAQTSEAMRESGLEVDFEASSPGIDQLVDAVVKALA